MSVEDVARKAARASSVVSALGTIASLKIEGRPVKEKDKPAKVSFLGLPWFERLENGKQYVLWFRIRDVRR